MTVILIFLCTQHAALSLEIKLLSFKNALGQLPLSESVSDEIKSVNKQCSEESPVKYATRSRIENVKTLEKKCFICNEIRSVDNNRCNEGGLQRCSRGTTAEKLLSRKEVFLQDKAYRFHDAAKRLDILLSAASHEIFVT